jgi:pimeloyl-ACP methyl ester carboxylesterase
MHAMRDTYDTRDARDTIPCRTADGLSLSVRRIAADRGPSRGAVILQHGLGSNGRVFDLPQRSLARALAASGFDCFIPELRGAGDSPKPQASFGLDQYLEQDLPAILASVLDSTGRSQVSWVGHSLGGILMMMYAIEHPDAPIDRFVAIGSSLDYSAGDSVFRNLLKARPLAGAWLKTFPFGKLSKLQAPFAGRGPVLPTERINFWRRNVEREVMREILAHGFDDIPMDLLDDLATTFGASGFARKRGALAYLPRTQDFALHTCLIGGSRDLQAPPAGIDRTAELLASAKTLEVARMGTPHGHAEDYGHIDLVMGKHAAHEVWPTITRFLQRGAS